MIRVVCFILAAAALSGANPCGTCHPKQTAGFAATPMGRSLGRPERVPAGSFLHTVSKSRFGVRWDGDHVVQTVERGGVRAEHAAAFAIGSGNHARGYLIQTGDRLWQSPIAYYPRRKQWDMAPGYESNPAPDFNRPVTSECLLCHSGGARPVPDAENRYQQPAFTAQAITCERCHGPAEAHLRKPAKGTIVNPSRLAPAERDSVCEQCHLNGEARILNPGVSFEAFVPGQRLEDVFSVVVFDRSPGEHRRDLKVVSHAEQLASSACSRKSGRLWCGSCHSAHGEPVNYAERCSGCHAAASLPAAHPQKAPNCTDCHMPKRPAVDGAHTAFTDHRIRRRAVDNAPGDNNPSLLRAWRPSSDPLLRQRNLGLAYIAAGERDGSAEQLNRGYELLAAAFPKYPKDPQILASLGMVLFLKDQFGDAAKLLQEAVRLRPGYAPGYEKLGVVLKAAGRKAEAKAALERAIELDEGREVPYHLLAELSDSAVERRRILEQYLRVMPGSVIAAEALRALPAR